MPMSSVAHSQNKCMQQIQKSHIGHFNAFKLTICLLIIMEIDTLYDKLNCVHITGTIRTHYDHLITIHKFI